MFISEKIIAKFYKRGSKAYSVLLAHGIQVALKAVEILNKQKLSPNIDKNFIVEASMLHDIGICMTYAKSIGCFGSLPYLCHGIEGKKILDNFGMYKHGLVCERHIGIGLKAEDIYRMNLPLPVRDMIPISVEERLICYADKFFSKGESNNKKNELTIIKELSKYGVDKIIDFFKLHDFFINQNKF